LGAADGDQLAQSADHRGAVAADGKTGDGCGLLIKQPTAFLRAAAKESGSRRRPCSPPAWYF